MSTQPFGQTSAFGGPPAPPEVVEPEPGSTRSSRTVVMAVAAGVVALGVLGGAGYLVLAGGDDDDVTAALPPASVAPVEPVAPSTAPPSPLPTAAVQARNVFVPLVEESTEAAAAGDTSGATSDGGSATAAPTSSPTSSATVPASGPGSFPLPVPTVTVTESSSLTEYLTDTELLRELRAQIAELEAELDDTSDEETIADLLDEIERLQAELLDLQDLPTYDFDVLVQEVLEPENADSAVVFVLADDSEEGFTEYVVSTLDEVRTFGENDELTYLAYDPGTGVVTFRYVSNVYDVVPGTALGFSVTPTITTPATP